MKTLARLTILLAIVLLAFALAGCRSDDSSDLTVNTDDNPFTPPDDTFPPGPPPGPPPHGHHRH